MRFRRKYKRMEKLFDVERERQQLNDFLSKASHAAIFRYEPFKKINLVIVSYRVYE